ncbi:MAG: DEAD/DEAH box helicase [Armatimonadota bacterium]|nr:DEAD/DEAH box helicase [Armatimonadota bacterium]MDR7448448.1 DEAD/DEAH box helicase [Armatimonadota bacterium]MDR7480370.1 DEAD/DEAH box helicase [Armatimonadota bacterium]MDR7491323.1 DEAD/DEAH box helicase [Armatimonadota bacterium]MDR7502089.1 DEAD/DEAH box helicase [Armatimonadota bacterium]
MTLEQLLDRLRHDPRFAARITAWHELPARRARYAPFPEDLHPRLVEGLRRRGVTTLYTHQAAAYRAAAEGRHLVVVTPTASGKTLCYTLPVLDRILKAPETRALYLFPTKALGADQVDELQSLVAATGADITTFTYDGDTPAPARRAIRAAGHVVVTNPDMLHTAILPHHTKWLRLFESLRYVVIDEVHHYRGVFGSHVANVLRRLWRVCRFYGSAPQVICTSATIGNPQEHAGRLVGAPVTLIDDNGAPAGPRVVVLLNPPVVNRALGIRRDTLLEVRDLARELVAGGVPTIVFARSRLAAELLTAYLRDLAARSGGEAESVRGYRAGYLPSERRAIERGLRQGTVRAVASTNALELGIDIGQLGAAVLAGYPGTIASTWQQIGRAGRTGELAAAFLVATSDPLDQYLVTHPAYLFGRSPEEAWIHPDNPLVLASHLRCAVFELPLGHDEPFGPEPPLRLLQHLAAQGMVHDDGTRWHYVAETFPAEEVSLRSASTENVVVIDTTDPQPRVIGEVDLASAPGLVHEGAIYLHLGRQHHVDRLDWEARKAYVRRVDVDYYTQAEIAVRLAVLTEAATTGRTPGPAPHAAGTADALQAAHGEVALTFRPTVYKKLKLFTHENVGWGKIALPETTLHTTAAWVWLAPEALRWRSADRLHGALAALGHVLLAVAPLALMCDPQDLGRVVEVRSPHTGAPTVYLYERAPGGVGLAERLFRFLDRLATAAADLVAGCPCAAGCPSCVGPPLEVGAHGKADARLLLQEATRPLQEAARRMVVETSP